MTTTIDTRPGRRLTREEMQPEVGGYYDGLATLLHGQGFDGLRVYAEQRADDLSQGLVLGGEIPRAGYDYLVDSLVLLNEEFPKVMSRPNFADAGPDRLRVLPTLI